MLLGQLYWLRRQGQAIDQRMSKVAAALEPAELQPCPAKKRAPFDVPPAPTQLSGSTSSDSQPKALLAINSDDFSTEDGHPGRVAQRWLLDGN